MNKLKQRIKDRLGEKRTASLKKALKIARVVKNVICWLMIAVLTLAIVVFMITKINGGSPTLFGYSIHRIVSGSMSPELEIGDVIVGKQVTDTSDVSVGDIITFQGDSRFDNQKVTHRVLVAPYSNGSGNTVVVTKGDANEIDDGEISFSDIKSKCIAKVVFLKDIYNFFFSQWGLITFIVLLLLIFLDEIINIVKLIVSGREQEHTETLYEIVERLQREQQEKQNSSLDENGESNYLLKSKQMNEDTANMTKAVENVESFPEDKNKPHTKTAKKNKCQELQRKDVSNKEVAKEKTQKKRKTGKKHLTKTFGNDPIAVKKKTKKKSKKKSKRKKKR